MKAKIQVLQPGLYSSIQDIGRFGFRKYGIPQSGVMDSYAAKMSNLILNNSEDASVLEITQMGPKLQFSEATLITICGAFMNPKLNEKNIFNHSIIEVKSGDVLSFGKLEYGCRAYLAISGGFMVDKVLNSYSWYEGITAVFKLKKGDELFYKRENQSVGQKNSGIRVLTNYIKDNSITAFKGPEYHLLSNQQEQQLNLFSFRIDQKNNRMAIQMQEPLINELKPIITGPVLPGTVQLTPSGNIIVLMRDCQTTGGYPRILQVSEDGINALSQRLAGGNIKFDLQILK